MPAPKDERAARSPAQHRVAPLLLFLLIAVSFAIRVVRISDPKDFVFDELYYVNAARVILGRSVPVGEPYFGARFHHDPNTEHPPLGKLFIAAGILIFGDRPLGWRSPSLLFGTLGIAGMYVLARSARATRGQALAATALMAADNLFLVHSRIAVLDIYVVVFMIFAVASYLRGHPLLAGVLIAFGACTKLVGVVALAGIYALALFPTRKRASPSPGPSVPAGEPTHRMRTLLLCTVATIAVYTLALTLLDNLLGSYRNPITHTGHMIQYGSQLTTQRYKLSRILDANHAAPPSTPLQWLANRVPITYYSRRPTSPSHANPTVNIVGEMTPFIIWFAVPTAGMAFYRARQDTDPLSLLAVTWIATTYTLFVILSLRERISYIHYMLPVLPGIYVAIATFFARPAIPRLLSILYGAFVLVSFCSLYPYRF